jgi:hypothetical protein
MERVNWALALKAEVVLAWQLTTRHRAPRIALLMFFLLIGLLVVEHAQPTGPGRRDSVLIMAGVLSSVGSSRLLSRGAALESVKRIAAPGWLPLIGRLCGMLLFAVLPVAGAVTVTAGDSGKIICQLVMLATYIGALGSWVMVLTPLFGASGAAGAGLMVSLVGRLTPEDVSSLFSQTPTLARMVASAWSVFPLAWHVSQSLQSEATNAWFLFASWTALGLAMAAWISGRATSRPVRRRNP